MIVHASARVRKSLLGTRPLPRLAEIGWNAFPTKLGWMAIAGRGEVLCAVTFGHATLAAARKALAKCVMELGQEAWNPKLAKLLNSYAAGKAVDFRHVIVDKGGMSPFQVQVLELCQQIPYGETCTYGELAQMAGKPGAARAVGNVIRQNQTPIVVPCHRVVGSAHSLRGYSAPGGLDTKLALLRMEGSWD